MITNLSYVDALGLALLNPQRAAALNWQEVRLAGTASHDFSEQIEALAPMLVHGWETKPSPKTGNPIPSRPTVLVVYRQDHEFILNRVIPRPTNFVGKYDFALASQPWRASVDATFKAQKILAPLTRSLAPGGRLLAIQSWGRDPAAEIVERIWPDERPFPIDRHALLEALRLELGESAAQYDLSDPPDSEAVFRYHMHTLPSEIGDRIGTSTLFAAWNAVIYVNQIQDDRIEDAAHRSGYMDVTQEVLHKYGGLWFNDEAFVVERGTGRGGDGARHRLGEPGVFVIAAELVTSRGLEDRAGSGLFAYAHALAADGRVDVFSITDNPGGNPMSAPDTVAADLASRGCEVIIHLATKDSNRNALESRAWKLASEGFNNVLALSGDYPIRVTAA